jgi:hypothetical protein
MFGCPGDDRILADDGRSIGEREDWKHLLSADSLELGTLACCADAARSALAEDHTLVLDPCLIECFMGATASVRE